MNVNTGLCATSVARVQAPLEELAVDASERTLERRGHGASYSAHHEVSTPGAQIDTGD